MKLGDTTDFKGLCVRVEHINVDRLPKPIKILSVPDKKTTPRSKKIKD